MRKKTSAFFFKRRCYVFHDRYNPATKILKAKTGKTTTKPNRTAVTVITRRALVICSGEMPWSSPKV